MQPNKPRTAPVGHSRLVFCPRWVMDPQCWAESMDEVEEATSERKLGQAPSKGIYEPTLSRSEY